MELPIRLTIPLHPSISLFFVLILIIPTAPSASFLAEGVVNTSILSICPAEICSKAAAPFKEPGFPSIYTLNPELPRKVISPSASTRIEGVCIRMSAAVPPAAERNSAASITCLSSLYTTCRLRPVTTTSDKSCSLSSSRISGNTIFLFSVEISNVLVLSGSYPIKLTAMKYPPLSLGVRLKFPEISVAV